MKRIWNAVKNPPSDALKKITGGRLSGMTDISPQWRLEIMTETFGPVGVGWNYRITKQWLETPEKDALTETHEICAFTNIELKFKYDGEWSEWIPGTGGSKMAAKEKYGLHISDECFKMSLTDALSVAMKAVGVGADVYQGKVDHASKYPTQGTESEKTGKKYLTCPACKKEAVIAGKKEFGGGYVCWKKEGGCGAKFKTLGNVENPEAARIATLVESISRAEAKFKAAGKEAEYKKILDRFKVDNADEITNEKDAKAALTLLSSQYKALKIEGEIK